MSDPPREPERNAATSLRDLLVIGGVLVALFVLGAFLGFFEHLSDWLLTREQSGGVFALVTLLAVGAAIFAILRWRQALVETSRRVEAERRYRFLVEQSPAVSYSRTPVTSGGDATVFVSPQIEQLLGYSAEEWVANPGLWLERLHPDDRDDAVARSNTADTTGRPFHMEYRLIDREGAVVWVHDEARTVARDAQG
ncbi:MAG TPA: PAS domain-containing protein, partial [Actinomycetota bacterium]|nr:PAS domain-containing protein [Actinomycetota bacterium]